MIDDVYSKMLMLLLFHKWMHPLFSAFTSGYGSGKIIEMTKIWQSYSEIYCPFLSSTAEM